MFLSKNAKQFLGICLIIVGIILPFYLATKEIISEILFIFSIVGFSLVGFLVYKIDDIIEFETRWVKMKTLQREIYAKVEEVQKISEKLDRNREDLRKATKAFVESFYLSLSTRNRFPIPKQVAEIIEKNLDILIQFSFEGEEDLKQWGKKMKEILGSRK